MTVQAPLMVSYTDSHHVTQRPAVIVSIGSHEVAVLDPCREWQVGEPEFAIAAETVIPYLRRLFGPEKTPEKTPLPSLWFGEMP